MLFLLSNGKTYNKRGLVYAVIYFLATQHKIDSGEELRKMFPDKIQGSLGVIRRIESARQYTNAEKRYYLKPAEMLTFCDGQYAVCCQWDKHNIERFIKRANQYGCTIFYIEEEDF